MISPLRVLGWVASLVASVLVIASCAASDDAGADLGDASTGGFVTSSGEDTGGTGGDILVGTGGAGASVSIATGGSDGLAAGPCIEPNVECGGACVDTSRDPDHCGGCDSPCTTLGEKCIEGTCQCPEGALICGDGCVDVRLDVNNCGSCGNACTGDDVCVLGECVENPCPTDQLPCNGPDGCVYVPSSIEHCGACGISCDGQGQWCEDGRCRCPQDHRLCGGACVHVLSNVRNCGSCGVECVGNQYCDQGTCVCPQGQVLCGGMCQQADECPELSDPPSGTGGSSSGGTSGTGGSSSGGDQYCGSSPLVSGRATSYSLGLSTPRVACGYPADSLPAYDLDESGGGALYFAALNEADYADAKACGACVEVHGPASKTLVVEVVDECPVEGNEAWCWAGSHHLDLSPDAFAYFAEDPSLGAVDIEWRYVPCPAQGNLRYTFREGSSVWWTAVLIRNYPVPIVSVDYKNATGYFKPLVRGDYNYWYDEGGFGEGPYALRVKDAAGSVVVEEGIAGLGAEPLEAPLEKQASVQLSGCQ